MSDQKKGVAHEVWYERRMALLEKEKSLTRLKDELAEERRALPWVAVDKDYLFSEAGKTLTLEDLFGGKTQLIVYHFMFGPEWQ